MKIVVYKGSYLAHNNFACSSKLSTRAYKHPTKAGRVTIAGHPSDEIAPGTLNSILKQTQIK